MTTNTTIFKETSVDDVIEMMGYLTNEVGIDGMLVAPGYQYSQIDPNLTMTRAEHEEKFRPSAPRSSATATAGWRAPIYQDFLTGERKLPCAPWGSITRNPYGWKGPCYLLTDGIFPTYEALVERDRVGALRARATTRAASTAASIPASSPSATLATTQRQGDGPEPRMDAR